MIVHCPYCQTQLQLKFVPTCSDRRFSCNCLDPNDTCFMYYLADDESFASFYVWMEVHHGTLVFEQRPIGWTVRLIAFQDNPTICQELNSQVSPDEALAILNRFSIICKDDTVFQILHDSIQTEFNITPANAIQKLKTFITFL